jgi:hypothetical protein
LTDVLTFIIILAKNHHYHAAAKEIPAEMISSIEAQRYFAIEKIIIPEISHKEQAAVIE